MITVRKPLVALLLMVLPGLAGAELWFPPSMISVDPNSVADLSRLTPSGSQLPGTYEVAVYLNGNWLMSRNIHFIAVEEATDNGITSVPASVSANNTSLISAITDRDIRDHTGLMACLTSGDWRDIGLKLDAVPTMVKLPEEECISPGRHIPHAYTEFDFQNMRLNISLPQALLHNRPRGWIAPERWDEGINALILSYRFNGSNSHSSSSNSRNLYLNLDNGLNIGAWRLRDTRNWSHYSDSRGGDQTIHERLNTYVERSIIPWRSQLLLGESSTDSELFDGFAFRGVKLSTDDSMYPDTLRGFAPVVKGAAYSNARITIRQNGSLIYQTFVPPGSFAIDDLYPISTGGDLDVTVTEADGTARTFTVPYSSVPLLQREGRIRYSVAAGRFRSSSNRYNNPEFAQGTLQWGLPYNTTAYSGVQVAERYWSGILGGGFNLGRWGALSADLTHANSELADGSHHTGQSVRFLYSRSMSSMGTTFRIAGYRYSTKGFHTLDETALKGMSGWLYDYDTLDAEGKPVKRPYTDYYNLNNTKRTRIQANISQRLGKYGSLYLTGSRQTYWNTDHSTDSLMAGYSGSAGSVNWSLSWSYSKANTQLHSDRMMYLSFSLPFSALLPGGDSARPTQARITGNISRNNNGRSSYMAGMSGTLLEDNNLNWNVQEGRTRGDGSSGNSGNAGLDYRGTYGSASMGYSHSPDYKQVSYGLTGGVVVHRDGITFGQQTGSTSILIAAPGATGVPVTGGTGIYTDWRGYALLPYSTAYRENTVSLDADGLDESTELETTSTQVVPTRGALVRAAFKVRHGTRALIMLTHKGKPLPFGTTVTGNNTSGIVGDDGEVYLSGLEAEGELKAQWGRHTHQQCTVRYRLTEQQMRQSPVQTSEMCL